MTILQFRRPSRTASYETAMGHVANAALQSAEAWTALLITLSPFAMAANTAKAISDCYADPATLRRREAMLRRKQFRIVNGGST